MSVIPAEQILVVPTEAFRRLGYFQGFCHQPQRYLRSLLARESLRFSPRDQMEQDPSFKQLIPYAIFRHQDPETGCQLFCYTRGIGQGEQRLHRKRSIGVGGHISRADRDMSDDPYREGLRRELEEEVIVDTDWQERCVGLINDDQTEVGRVHLGIVHLFDVSGPAVRPREPDILDAGFYPLDQLLGWLDTMESWSRICLEALFYPNDDAIR